MRVTTLRPDDPEYPQWVCTECGWGAADPALEHAVATFHYGRCGVCGKWRPVTEPRDFGYPTFVHLEIAPPTEEHADAS